MVEYMPTKFVLFLFQRYLTRELIWHKSIFHKALKDGIIAICYVRKSQHFPNKATTGTIFNLFGIMLSFINH